VTKLNESLTCRMFRRAICCSMADTLVVNEIYLSLQGESTFAGLPCIFIRLTGCDLRCSFCDTAYAFTEGRKWSMDEILHQINKLTIPYTPSNGGQQLPLIELTGGEPLLQRSVHLLMRKLCDQGFIDFNRKPAVRMTSAKSIPVSTASWISNARAAEKLYKTI